MLHRETNKNLNRWTLLGLPTQSTSTRCTLILQEGKKGQGSRASWTEHLEVPGGWHTKRGHGTFMSLPPLLTLPISPSVISFVLSFIINQSNTKMGLREPQLDLVGLMVTPCFTFEELPDCFPKGLHYFTILLACSHVFLNAWKKIKCRISHDTWKIPWKSCLSDYMFQRFTWNTTVPIHAAWLLWTPMARLRDCVAHTEETFILWPFSAC